jgi:phosphatidylserine synthase
MSELKTYGIPFLIGGCVVSGVKYASNNIKNPAVAAMIGGIPTGLISIYFVKNYKTIGYTNNYFFVTLALLTAIAIFYTLRVYTNLHKNIILLISLSTWAILVGIRYAISKKDN